MPLTCSCRALPLLYEPREQINLRHHCNRSQILVFVPIRNDGGTVPLEEPHQCLQGRIQSYLDEFAALGSSMALCLAICHGRFTLILRRRKVSNVFGVGDDFRDFGEVEHKIANGGVGARPTLAHPAEYISQSY